MKKLIAIICLLVTFSFSASTTTSASPPQSKYDYIQPENCQTYEILCLDLHIAGYAVSCSAFDYVTWMHLLC